MSNVQERPPKPLPMWLMAAGNVFAVGHLLAIGLLALAAPSGPWITNFGPSDAFGPQFAQSITNNITVPWYFQPLRMSHNYHFKSNHPAGTAAYFEVLLRDESGDVVKTLKFPNEKANFWVRHRQNILAQGLAEDQPVQPRGSEMIAPSKDKTAEIEYWDVHEPGTLRLKKEPKHKVPNDRFAPSEWSKVLAQSYLRYLCREHGMTSAKLVRYSKEAIMPAVLFRPDALTAEMLPAVLKSEFGEYRREN